MFSITGIVKVKKETQQITDSFKKREFVLTDASGNYPQDILFQLTQDRVDLIDNINEQEMITVTFNLRGREWTSPQGEVKYFNSLDAWRVEKAGNSTAQQPSSGENQSAGMTPKSADDAETLVDESDDDLPF